MPFCELKGDGKMKTVKNTLSVFDKHQLAIARKTLTYSDIGARIMGGMTMDEARAIIFRLTGRRAAADELGEGR
jgi:hypothetical protein